jgi:N-acetylneuraminic acid mutarotase
MSQNRNAAILMGLCFGLTGCDRSEPTEPEAVSSGPSDASSLAVTSNTWATKRSLSPWRTFMAAGTINGVIYVVGGRRRSEPATLARLDAYHIATNTWTQKASLPASREKLNGASVINGKLYVSGGLNKDHRGTRTLFVYDPVTNSWSRKADMPHTTCWGSQGAIGGRLYVYVPGLGGELPPSTCYPSRKGVFFRYDPATNTWITRAAPPTDHKYGASGVIDGKFYLAGGYKLSPSCSVDPESGNCHEEGDDALDVYDPVTNTWANKASMLGYREHMASAVLNGKLYIMGGNGSTVYGEQSDAVEVYNPVINKWTIKAPLPRGSIFGAAAGGSGKVYYIEGAIDPTTGASVTDPSKVYAYTP